MKTIIIALGDYQARAIKLAEVLGDCVVVTNADLLPLHANDNPAIASRLAKTGFASYIPGGYAGPVCLMDADVIVRDGLFAELPPITAPVAGVCVGGLGNTYQLSRPFQGQTMTDPLNSGFLVFATVADAQAISAAWHASYLSYYQVVGRDEIGLYKALAQLGITPQYLDAKFNSTDPQTGLLLHGKQFSWAQVQVPAPLPEIPSEIANWRAKEVLDRHGLLATVQGLIDALEGDDGSAVKRAWNGGAPLDRYGVTVTTLGPQLGLTDAQIDAMFVEAAALAV